MTGASSLEERRIGFGSERAGKKWGVIVKGIMESGGMSVEKRNNTLLSNSGRRNAQTHETRSCWATMYNRTVMYRALHKEIVSRLID